MKPVLELLTDNAKAEVPHSTSADSLYRRPNSLILGEIIEGACAESFFDELSSRTRLQALKFTLEALDICDAQQPPPFDSTPQSQFLNVMRGLRHFE
jgi:hypothetical protein